MSSIIKRFNYFVKSVRIRIFSGPYFSRIPAEWGEMRSISLYSVRIRENTDQKNSEYVHFSCSEFSFFIFSLKYGHLRFNSLL